MKNKLQQLGQGMTEYIIIVALIAIAAIAVYGFFGDTVRNQVSAMTQELAGEDGSAGIKAAGTAAKSAGAEQGSRTLSDYNGASAE
jgi:Flp pilus assembly pilin Flp